MSYTLPSDDDLLRAFDVPADPSLAELRPALRAVARLAIEHYRAESAKATGVDVEALAESCCDCEGVVHYDGCWVPLHGDRVADAIRTAIAQAVAKERERIERVQVRFDGPPSHEGGRIVEVETAAGKSINFGAWVQDGTDWLLVFDAIREGANQ